MAISLSTDIVMDVARAADPQRAAEVRARLANGPVATGTFDVGAMARTSEPVADPTRTATERVGAKEKFEAMVLQTFLQSMMPEGEQVYGEGLSGDMWKSLMAQEMAGVMAKRGGIGIADRLLKDYAMDGEQKVALAGHTPQSMQEADGDRALVATAVVEDLQRKLMQSLTQDLAGTDRSVGRE